jgi:pimeloyl-ACP methyl ester carboxylesterase
MRKHFVSLCLPCLVLLACACATARPSEGPGSGEPQVRSLPLPTGVTLQYAELGNPRAPVLLLVHGYTDSWKSFQLVMPGLAPKYRAISVSLRGFGDSSRPESGYSGAELTADLVALMDALKIERAVVVGHSMGSFIAQQLAFAHPDRVEALVLVGSAPTVNNEGVQGLRSAVSALTDPVDPTFVRDFQVSTVHRAPPGWFMEQAIAESLKVPARVWKAAVDGVLAEDYRADLGRIRAPTLVMWGDKDSVFSQAEQTALVSAIPGARLVTFPDIGHAPHWEDPERFVAELGAFLESVAKK